jgi:hypothetical protein
VLAALAGGAVYARRQRSSPKGPPALTARPRLSCASPDRLADLRQSYAAIEATVKLFDPEAAKHRVRPKLPYTRVRLFGGGKLSRLVLDALRVSASPMTASELVAAIVASLGYGDEAVQAIADRVPATLSYMARTRGSVAKEGEGRAVKWSLRSADAK